METASLISAFLARLLLVLLFFPFSALDKILNFKSARAQAADMLPGPWASGAILAGLSIEIFMSLAVLSGIADKAAALILATYCTATALLWKQFWKPGDFWASSTGKARGLFWDFLKNLAVAGGFLLITFGPSAQSAASFFEAPFASSHPYRLHQSWTKP